MSAKREVDAIRTAQHGKASTRVPGHQMPWEGKATQTQGGWPTRQSIGSAFCSCGVKSPELDSNSARQRWHREHKLDVLSGGAA